MRARRYGRLRDRARHHGRDGRRRPGHHRHGCCPPDHQHQGHGRALLAEAEARARTLRLVTLDAWIRDLPDTLRWYRAMGFLESDHYPHVYANYYTDPGEPGRAIGSRRRT
ncbi:GNAT family N-acetyltransferase [Streptomyces sp. NPDC048425]|uniref:GNAT family N-acetyltransferase n=1 Tax=Streptomyces sp. NPDC048425 TaxID=3365548 RepID=UPI003716ED6C